MTEAFIARRYTARDIVPSYSKGLVRERQKRREHEGRSQRRREGEGQLGEQITSNRRREKERETKEEKRQGGRSRRRREGEG